MQNLKKYKINFLTLFPKLYDIFKSESIIKRSIEKDKVEIEVIDFRNYAQNKHNQIDDISYGGGQGMLLMVEPIHKAIQSLGKSHVILLSPQGKKFDQKKALKLLEKKNITLIAGHYEGFDERIRSYIDEEISIGDYILTGGELPSMIVAEAVIRLIPGVINEKSHQNDSFSNNLLDYPQYTKPRVYDNMKVPEVLLNGNHKLINAWRKEQQIKKTKLIRPDLLKKGETHEK